MLQVNNIIVFGKNISYVGELFDSIKEAIENERVIRNEKIIKIDFFGVVERAIKVEEITISAKTIPVNGKIKSANYISKEREFFVVNGLEYHNDAFIEISEN